MVEGSLGIEEHMLHFLASAVFREKRRKPVDFMEVIDFQSETGNSSK